ncbi:membrane-associated proteins in eicosanoid and glutathione metabolism [Nemania sp. FL0916]|nr:membrane-associated proteins in eicosanoid and glutathione metabolism [Nemania sp. FL0916]
MSFALEVPREYGYVLATATASLFVNTFHRVLTSRARAAAGIAYPTAYASQEQADRDPKAFKFNSAQRAHANFTENHASFVTSLLIAGLRYPGPAAYAGAAWVAGRLAYAYAYTSYGPKARGLGFGVAQLGKAALVAMALSACYGMIQTA